MSISDSHLAITLLSDLSLIPALVGGVVFLVFVLFFLINLRLIS